VADPAETIPVTKRRRIVVLRHGRTVWNDQRRFQGRTDVPLDDVGVAQADAAAAQLERVEPAIVLTSDAIRAQQTAEVLATRVGVEARPDPRLREADLGSWEGLTRDEAQRRFPREYLAWRHGIDIRRGGGETYAEVAERAAAAVAESLDRLPEGQAMVVVTHGGTARAVIGRLLGLAPDSWHRLSSLAHGRWAVLEEAAVGWRLDEHNVKPRTHPRST
jgi:probable phosphoglycerate mutase